MEINVRKHEEICILDIKGELGIHCTSTDSITFKVGPSFVNIETGGVTIGGPEIRLNSGGAGGALAVYLDRLEALVRRGVDAHGIDPAEDVVERLGAEIQEFAEQDVEEYTQIYRVLTRDGEIRWVEDQTSVVRDDKGIKTHNQGIVVDITERKIAEEDLRKSEEKFRRSPYDASSVCRLGTWRSS